MEIEKKQKLRKVCAGVCVGIGLLSLLMFIPQVRELIIGMGERAVGRPLTHEVWHGRFIKWEIEFLLLVLTVVFLLSEKNIGENAWRNEKLYKILSWIFVGAVSVCLVVAAGISADIWLDETFSLGLARHGVKDLVRLTAQDVHPPLYYIFLRPAMLLFPNSVFAAKIVSVVPTILLLCVATAFFAKEYSYQSAFLFSVLLASTYSVLQYSVEIRMYSWSLLFCGLCAIASWYMVRTRSLKSFLLYILFAECGAYCHYYAAFGLAIHFVLMSVVCLAKDRKSLKNILIAAAVGFVLYLPWAIVVARRLIEVSGWFNVPSVTVNVFVGYLLMVIPMDIDGSGKTVSIVLIAWSFALCVRDFRKKDEKFGYFLASLFAPFLLILCATIISFAVRPMFLNRYAFPMLVFVVFFVVLACEECKASKKLVFTCFALLCSVINMILFFRSEKSTAVADRAFEKMMWEHRTERTVFMFSETVVDAKQIPRCIAYRYPESRIYGHEIPTLWASAYFYDRANLLDTLDGENDLCLVLSEDEEPPEEFAEAEPIVAQMSTYPANKFYFLKK